ncbi:hypothetical protein HPB51_015512 [Rhipicephalus microplus]|uniref:Uncharacterized protein n=1 Tax=Rhipicephalus microplus TaxID=6941 RepID=A0A9J6DGV2_RHIMP|nr:hypothetical protein HPB51_015512 [Rhipicephalus microplus]
MRPITVCPKCQEMYVPLAEVQLTHSRESADPRRQSPLHLFRRLAYPNQLKDLENFFGRHSSTISSLTIEVLRHLDEKFFHLLDDVNNYSWLTIDTLENFLKAIYAKGAPLINCWGFIDGTAHAVC